ncbi:hypothetical protein NE237_002794 [Protea cynaroides]|uniref:CCT domain-containing protein n=1 Tax=Protea cynaroides TaxID=273540 RepID=A0A9Q0KFW8_9MAGN|nr:hypothetical protein NE237_002794 [Protea cynaroides]
MNEYSDFFSHSSTSSSDFSGSPPEISTTAYFPELFPATVPPPTSSSINEVLAAALRSDIDYTSYAPLNLVSSTLQQSLPNQNPIFSSLYHQFGSQNIELQSHLHRHRSNSLLSDENCIIEGTNKVRCYSAEEKKERIQRYRTKRSQRNFNKKIKYACRKTLADSRPRIRGRFARNEEIGETFQTQWTQMSGEEDGEEDYIWTKFFSAFSTNFISIDP